MRFKNAKKLHNGDEVLIIDKNGKHPLLRPVHVVEVSIEDKEVFVRCDDGCLYHHTAFK